MLRGRLDRLHLGDLFEWLRLAGTDGWLTLTGGGVEARFLLRSGRIAFASSAAAGERLGSWLADRRLVPEERLYQALLRSLLGGHRLTHLLLEEGLLSRGVLRDELVELTIRLLRRLLVMPGMSFRFEPLDRTGPAEGLELDLELDPGSALLEAARRTDENGPESTAATVAFPLAEEDAERLFWTLVHEAYPDQVDLSGPALARAHNLVRDAVATLGQWLRTSPGLVPMPPAELEPGPPSAPAALAGRPHLVWNLLVLAWALPARPRCAPDLGALASFAADEELWLELRTSERWLRPARPRLDGVLAALARDLASATTAAAGHLDLDPALAALAAHLLVVPTAMVLYVLATIPIPAERIRRELLHRLPPTLGAGLAERAGIPDPVGTIFSRKGEPLTAALALARALVPNGSLLPEPTPDLPAVLSAGRLAEASAAAREALTPMSGS